MRPIRSRSAWLLLGGLFAAVVTAASLAQEPTSRPEGPLRAVVHVNFGETGRQGHGLRNIENVLKEVGDAGARFVVVCHGSGIALVERARSEHAEQVQALMKRGVEFVACQNTMKRNAIAPEDLLEGVAIVPGGALEVIRRQHDGYAYFRP